MVRGGRGDASGRGSDHCVHRVRISSRRRATDLGETFDALFTFYGFVHFLAALEMALSAGGQHVQVLPAARDARDHPSIIPTHPAHAEHPPMRPACLRRSIRLSQLRAGCGDSDGGGWRRSTAIWQPASRSDLAGSASPPARAIPRPSGGLWVTFSRPEERRTARSVQEGCWFLLARGSYE